MVFCVLYLKAFFKYYVIIWPNIFISLFTFFFKFKVGGGRGVESSENDQLTGHFKSYFSFSELFSISPEQTAKLVK